MSFGTVTHYDTFLVLIRQDELLGWGECTALTGYSWETAEEIHEFITATLCNRSHRDLLSLENFLYQQLLAHPFAVAPIMTALECFREPIQYGPHAIVLTALLSGSEEQQIAQNIRHLANLGYKSLKVKIGSDIEDDIRRVSLAAHYLPKDVKMRLDANQGYNFHEAHHLIECIPVHAVELLEQPFPPEKWQEMAELNAGSPVPLMLDESIWSEEDLHTAASHQAASLVKLKLFKHGSPANTCKLIQIAHKLGFEVILGNGVQTELGSLLEAAIYSKTGLHRAAEMNGPLKLPNAISNIRFQVINGQLNIKLDEPLAFTEDIARYEVYSNEFLLT